MPARPNFTEVRLKGGKITALGVSNDDDLGDIVGIQVVVRQEAKSARGDAKLTSGFVAQAGSSWQAELDANGIAAGPALVVGMETHSDPVTTIWWVESVEIQE